MYVRFSYHECSGNLSQKPRAGVTWGFYAAGFIECFIDGLTINAEETSLKNLGTKPRAGGLCSGFYRMFYRRPYHEYSGNLGQKPRSKTSLKNLGQKPRSKTSVKNLAQKPRSKTPHHYGITPFFISNAGYLFSIYVCFIVLESMRFMIKIKTLYF